MPSRALPPPSPYGLRITIKAHDLLLVKLASTAIRDLAMINLAPKSRDVLPQSMRTQGAGVPWVNLTMPIGDRPVPTRRTHFTVISGPHVHKTAREQFVRTSHIRVVSVSTNNLAELDWLLHSIKMYKFAGVELSMRITSSSYLLPTSTSDQDAAQQPLLAGHKQRFSHLFGAAAPSSNASAAATASTSTNSSSSYAALQQSLQGLRADLHQGLLQQRAGLAASSRFERWQQANRSSPAAAGAGAGTGLPAANKLPEQQLQDAVAQQVEGSSLLAAQEEGDGDSSSRVGSSREQALLRAVDKLLANVDAEGLDRHKYFPYYMAFYQPGKHQVSPAAWMQALLMYGKHRQAEVEAAQQPGARKGYAGYGQASKAALLLALQQWAQAADAESRRQLGMPDAEQVEELRPADSR